MNAWQVTIDDIQAVFLNEFNKELSYEKASDILDQIDTNYICDAVLYSTDFEEQCAIAKRCIKEEIIDNNLVEN